MVKYSCENCKTLFAQKGHLEAHKNRKYTCKKDNTIEALVEKKVQEVLSKMNDNTIKIDSKKTTKLQSNTMDYSSKTREELIALCKEKKIKGYSGKKKGEITKLLTDSEQKNEVIMPCSEKQSDEISSQDSKPLLPTEARIVVDHIVSQSQSQSQSQLKFIDLFCGIGGFHQAFVSLGAKCVYACDIDDKCREIYKKNYGIEPDKDITKVDENKIPDFDILCGGFPCQAFSHAGKQGGFEDTRGTLFRDIVRILRAKKPKYFLLENVKNLAGHDKGRTWVIIKNALKEVGYSTYEEPIVMSPHILGIPQHRERVLILGWRNDMLKNGLPSLPMVVPKGSNISSILEDDDKEIMDDKLISVLGLWEEFIQHFKLENIKLPTFPIWCDDWDSTYSLKDLPEWKSKFITKNREFYKNNKEWLESWLKRARENKSFNGAKRKLEWQCGIFQQNDSLWNLLFQFRPSGIRVKRMNYSPALVAMAQIVYVGEKRRKLTPREVARLQCFPDSFKLPTSSSVAYKQFGNSVNVEVIKWAANHLLGVQG